MFNKSKYDVMKKDMKGVGLFAISFAIKISRLNSKFKKGKINEDQINMEVVTILDDVLPLIKKASHIIYENSKDLETVDKQKLLGYVQKKGINPTQFAYNYAKSKRQMTQILMAFALLDRDNIQFPSFKDPEMALKLLNGESIQDILGDVFDDLSDETTYTLFDVFDDDFELSDLKEEDAQLLEDYHNRYMMQNIYPKVTQQVTPELEIIKMAESFGKSKKK